MEQRERERERERKRERKRLNNQKIDRVTRKREKIIEEKLRYRQQKQRKSCSVTRFGDFWTLGNF